LSITLEPCGLAPINAEKMAWFFAQLPHWETMRKRGGSAVGAEGVRVKSARRTKNGNALVLIRASGTNPEDVGLSNRQRDDCVVVFAFRHIKMANASQLHPS
jgi:hypothetical protein